MGRKNFGIEIGIDFYAQDGDAPVIAHLFGAGLPGGDAGPQDASGVGSMYNRTDGKMYRKTGSANSTDDWVEMVNADLTQLSFRSELVRAGTGEALAAGVRDLTASPFTDDDTPFLVATDFTVGEFIISGIGGVPKLFEVTVVSSPNITLVEETTNVLADNDTFIIRNYLPDSPDDQEKQAIVMYNGTDIIKVGDFNWEFATGINLSSGFTKANGTVTSADTVETALEKLAANQEDLTTLSGVAQGAVDLGTFTGDCIADSQTIKAALQDLETCIEALGTIGLAQAIGVTAATILDSILVDNALASEWELHMVEDANPTRIKIEKIFASHDNINAGADATNVDQSVFAKLKLGSNFNATATVELSGAGAAQVMRLSVASSTAGVTFTSRRTDITAP